MKKQYNAIALLGLTNGRKSLTTVCVINERVWASSGTWSHLNYTESYHDSVWIPSHTGGIYTGEVEFRICKNRKELSKKFIEAMQEL